MAEEADSTETVHLTGGLLARWDKRMNRAVLWTDTAQREWVSINSGQWRRLCVFMHEMRQARTRKPEAA